MNKYETVIGLEFHAELKTAAKIFCFCPTSFEAAPNSHICPVCLGLPGVLPVLNKNVVNMAIKAGLALNCQIQSFSKFDRKNYFYPDLPKAYQITQFHFPICRDGYLEIGEGEKKKKIRINRIHMEEDAGKLIHSGDNITDSSFSRADYNRAAVPLIEIVTEPDIASAEEALAFGQLLKLTLEYAGVCDGRMEQGSLRCDVNVSLKAPGDKRLGIRREIKNLNSFKAMLRTIKYEEEYQAEILNGGGTISQETLAWDDNLGRTFSMRGKEDAHDYRYFPEPDLTPVIIDDAWIKDIEKEMVQMPPARFKRLNEELKLSPYDAHKITDSPALALFFDETLKYFADAKIIANWLLGDISHLINTQKAEDEEGISHIPLNPEDVALLLQKIKDGVINNNSGKIVLEEMFFKGGGAEEIIAAKGFGQISDISALSAAVAEIIAQNPKPAADYRAGKQKSAGFLLGQVMKATGGQANPQMARELLLKALEKDNQ
jgi:aspartyl-tRNA(Asn)/glutamyl-tRNA(Gln) amidotransferase subunit B